MSKTVTELKLSWDSHPAIVQWSPRKLELIIHVLDVHARASQATDAPETGGWRDRTRSLPTASAGSQSKTLD